MRLLTYTLAIALGCAPLVAKDDKEKNADRLDDAASLFSEIMGAPDKSIPQDLLNKSQCMVLVPGLNVPLLLQARSALFRVSWAPGSEFTIPLG